jgi:hypothetical protein
VEKWAKQFGTTIQPDKNAQPNVSENSNLYGSTEEHLQNIRIQSPEAKFLDRLRGKNHYWN